MFASLRSKKRQKSQLSLKYVYLEIDLQDIKFCAKMCLCWVCILYRSVFGDLEKNLF